MRESDVYEALARMSSHPVTYGVLAGVARFAIGDKTAGWKAFITNIVVSMFVALGTMLYLLEEPYTDGKKAFYTIVASFLARDLLVALLSIGAQFSKDPMGFFARLREAFKGGSKS